MEIPERIPADWAEIAAEEFETLEDARKAVAALFHIVSHQRMSRTWECPSGHSETPHIQTVGQYSAGLPKCPECGQYMRPYASAAMERIIAIAERCRSERDTAAELAQAARDRADAAEAELKKYTRVEKLPLTVYLGSYSNAVERGYHIDALLSALSEIKMQSGPGRQFERYCEACHETDGGHLPGCVNAKREAPRGDKPQLPACPYCQARGGHLLDCTRPK